MEHVRPRFVNRQPAHPRHQKNHEGFADLPGTRRKRSVPVCGGEVSAGKLEGANRPLRATGVRRAG